MKTIIICLKVLLYIIMLRLTFNTVISAYNAFGHFFIPNDENLLSLFNNSGSSYINIKEGMLIPYITFHSLHLALQLFLLYYLGKLTLIISNLKAGFYFDPTQAKVFRQTGYYILFYTCLKLINTVYIYFTNSNDGIRDYIFKSIGSYVLLAIISFFILVIAQLIKEGILLKQENDLTI